MKDQRDQQVISSLIIFSLVIMVILAISGCATAVPVTAKFPEPPGKGAMTVCPDLQKLKDNAKLSDVANTVTVNYSTYYECAVKTDAWQEWYRIQKIIHEGAQK
ncbi:MAG: hypothetical protein EBU08_10855 [Micrococcales bacterium]|nr:hypothetical protein [Micrococcales bacterium]